MNRQHFDNNGGTAQVVGRVENSTLYHNQYQYFGAQDHDRQHTHRCLDYLAETDPRDIKRRIYHTGSPALKKSYEWILCHPQFQSWRDSNDNQVLWIKGAPGKGKTMLLCGIIDELSPTTKPGSTQVKTLLSFFFCQATSPKLSNAHAVLCGLIYMLVDTQPSLVSYIRKRFKDTGEPRFKGTEVWAALCNMLLDILRDSNEVKIYIMVDALDECVQDQDKLLQFILQETRELPHVRWIVSSRNHVEQRTKLEESQSILSLELQENADLVSGAIGAYISDRISKLKSLQDKLDREYIEQVLHKKAEGTFLWVALVIQELGVVNSWDVRQIVDDVPTGLDDLYSRMLDHLHKLAAQTRECCQLVLAATTLAYRPLQLLELGAVAGLPDRIAGNTENIETIVKSSGSFLTIRDDTIYFVHQSAKDYLIKKAGLSIFPSGSTAAHRRIFTQSLQVMNKTLRRNMYGLQALGTPLDQAKKPESDPLTAVGYSCVYWVDHLEESGKVGTWLQVIRIYWLRLASLLLGLFRGTSSVTRVDSLGQGGAAIFGLNEDVEDHGVVDTFLRQRYLYWLEALSLLRGMSEGILAIKKLQFYLRRRSGADKLQDLVQDAYRFIRYHRGAIEDSPLQAYGSALVFSPPQSIIKQLFQREGPKNIATLPVMGDNWDAHTGACLQTLEGHDREVNSVVFSHDSSRVASGSSDKTIKMWDAHTGACLQTLEGHNDWVTSVVFSHDSSRVASGSNDRTIKIWDAHTGACLQTLEGHNDWVTSVVFSHDSSRVASGSNDRTIKIWDAHTGACLQTLEGHDDWVTSVVFSYDSSRVASGSRDKTIKMWDAYTGACLQTLSVGSILENPSFDATGSSLHTDIGIDGLREWPTPAPPTATEVTASGLELRPVMQPSQIPEYQGYSISSDSFWITRNSQNWLWLPSMYRPVCSAVGQSGLVLVLGCQSGRVPIFRLAAEDRS